MPRKRKRNSNSSTISTTTTTTTLNKMPKQKFPNGCMISKIFHDPTTGNKRSYFGIISSFEFCKDSQKWMYLIIYPEDGDREHMTPQQATVHWKEYTRKNKGRGRRRQQQEHHQQQQEEDEERSRLEVAAAAGEIPELEHGLGRNLHENIHEVAADDAVVAAALHDPTILGGMDVVGGLDMHATTTAASSLTLGAEISLPPPANLGYNNNSNTAMTTASTNGGSPSSSLQHILFSKPL